MTYTATQDFVGVVGGVETKFRAGEEIDEADALEMGLPEKEEIAEETA